MLIESIKIDGVRNLRYTELHFSPGVNAFFGANGGGKTSILESIYFLAVGRSFRSVKTNNLISFNSDYAKVMATLSDKNLNQHIKVGSLKTKNQDKISEIAGGVVSGADIAMLAPIQLMNDESSRLVFKEPDLRRKFLDWLVFYTKNNYHNLWRDFNRALKQRNNILKKPDAQVMTILSPLDAVFADLSEKIKIARQSVWHKFEPIWQQMFDNLGLDSGIKPEIRLFHGWSGDLRAKLAENINHDLKFRTTGCGPHRADLLFLINGVAAKDVLSRGQGKVLSLAMVLARAKFIKINAEREGFVSILLIDDLSAELDEANIKKIIQGLLSLKKDVQICITGTGKEALLDIWSDKECCWFHVVGGVITKAEREKENQDC